MSFKCVLHGTSCSIAVELPGLKSGSVAWCGCLLYLRHDVVCH